MLGEKILSGGMQSVRYRRVSVWGTINAHASENEIDSAATHQTRTVSPKLSELEEMSTSAWHCMQRWIGIRFGPFMLRMQSETGP